MLGIGISFASFRRFWAAAARRNSSRAALFAEKQVVESGGLMAYGASIPASFRRATAHVDKIFRGANPADLPVETPTTFEFAINLKTAKALGLTIPQALLAIRIDRSFVAAHEPLHGPSTTLDNVRR